MSFTGVNSTNPTHTLLPSRYNPQVINSFKSHREFQKKILEWNLSTKGKIEHVKMGCCAYRHRWKGNSSGFKTTGTKQCINRKV